MPLAVPGASHAAGDFSLSNAPIPVSCGRAATNLDGYRKDFGGQGSASLEVRAAAYGKLRGYRGPVAAVPLACHRAGAEGSRYILLYAPGPALIGSFYLGGYKITKLRFKAGKVAVRYAGPIGNAAWKARYARTITWVRATGQPVLSRNRLLTIQYSGGVSVGDPGAAAPFGPAPVEFIRFLQRRWSWLYKVRKKECAQDEGFASVTVWQYSHKGFALGGDYVCGGGFAMWGKVKGRWRLVWGGQEGPACSELTAVQRRAFTALGGGCWDRKTKKVVVLGHWPTSG
jgi:hypothetical protein